MSETFVSVIIDKDPIRAESVIASFKKALESHGDWDGYKLVFVSFREISDFTALCCGNNRFCLIAVVVSGATAESLNCLKEFEDSASIVRVLGDDVLVDDCPPFKCKTIRFPLVDVAIDSIVGGLRP